MNVKESVLANGGFKSVKLDKVPIGTGAYGSVFKVQCDDLVCAAKLLHPTLVAGFAHARSPQKKFLDEIEFLGSLRHPNIVQYLGVRTDPDSNLPILLMELLDESLTQFLNRDHAPLALPTELSICHDITLALSYLHSNGIVHRDLSSNNVLMLGARRAKVSDFGMAKLQNRQVSKTLCPGTEVYMPPEAVQDKPTYTEKIDCFSFGVLAIQVMTKTSPSPGPRNLEVIVFGRKLLEPQSEYNRRENDIAKIPAGHVLRPVACDCLKDSEYERPSASLLCSIIAQLREKHEKLFDLKDTELTESRSEIEKLKSELKAKENAIKALEEDMQRLNERNEANVKYLQEKLNSVSLSGAEQSQKISASEEIKVLPEMAQPFDKKGGFTWKEAPRAPCPMIRSCDAVVCGSFVYIIHTTTKSCLYVYNYIAESWCELLNCPTLFCSLAVIKNTVLIVGGIRQEDGHKSNDVFSLSSSSGYYSWSADYPPMPTKRRSVITASHGSYLVVMGGVSEDFSKQVEILCADSKTWFESSSLPSSLHTGSAAISGDKLLVMGGYADSSSSVYSILSCNVNSLVNSGKSFSEQGEERSIWTKSYLELPVVLGTSIVFQNRILVLGGTKSRKQYNPSCAVLAYNEATGSWTEVSHFTVGRYQCIAATLLNDEILVCGGYTGKNSSLETEHCEIARFVT